MSDEFAGLAPSSQAFDLVVEDDHKPSDDAGGPCATCAFRKGTEANRTSHTVELAKFCVEGISPFDCHEHKRLCRGWIAAVNLKAQVGDMDDKKIAACRLAAELFGRCIDAATEEDRKACQESSHGVSRGSRRKR